MARELFAIEEGSAGPQARDVYLTREDAETQTLDPRERVVRYVPDDVNDERAVLASVYARLQTFAEKLAARRLPAELYFEFAQIMNAAKGGLK